jgi:hypothetical protein
MNRILFVFLVSLFISCDNSSLKSPERPLVLSNIDTTFYKPHRPPPPHSFYGDYTFILDTSSKIYYHSKHSTLFCDFNCDYSRPDFIELLPPDLIVIEENNFSQFLSDSITQPLGKKAIVIISSVADTIQSPQYYSLIQFLKANYDKVVWDVRKITEEESIVLSYKKLNKNYDPKNIKWSNNFSYDEIPFSK